MKIYKYILATVFVSIASIYLSNKTFPYALAESGNSGENSSGSGKVENPNEHKPTLRPMATRDNNDKGPNERNMMYLRSNSGPGRDDFLRGSSEPGRKLEFMRGSSAPGDLLRKRLEDHDLAFTKEVHKGLKLEGVKLQSCEARQTNITNRLANLDSFVTNMINVFDGIATKVKNYYTSYLAAGGTAVSNYDALVSAINSKKDLVNSDLSKAKDDMKSFSCTGEDPKGYLTLFRTDMQQVKEDLQAYRKSIKDLISAIRPNIEHRDGKESSESTNSEEGN